jgi:gliding motility-associated lipoprotein GldH
MRTSAPFFILIVIITLSGCSRNGVFEKDVLIPGYKWETGFQPKIEFELNDTTSAYNVFIVFRHTNAYNYNNLWIKAAVKEPGSPNWKTGQYDLLLATNDKGWLGSGMDDIFEHRILIQPQTKFRKPGKYEYAIQQIMREDPLANAMNIGLRIEKAP